MWLCALLTACSPENQLSPAGSDPPSAPGSPPTTTGTTPSTTSTGPTTATTPTSTTIPTVDVDCTALEPIPAPYTTLAWVNGSEDFGFDADGNELGVSGGTLFRTPYGGPPAPVVPGLSDSIRGERVTADGTMAMADPEHQSIVGVDPDTGATWIIGGGIDNANGVAPGADGWIYAAITGRIIRVEPGTGDVEVVADVSGHSFDGLTFSPDYTRLYFDEEVGRIWSVDFDAYDQPSQPTLFVDMPIGAFSLLDGLSMDACGDLYVVEMGGTVWRVTPDGTPAHAVDIPGIGVISSINFGSGVGGWDAETLYAMDFTGKLYAAYLGVPGKWEPYMGP